MFPELIELSVRLEFIAGARGGAQQIFSLLFYFPIDILDSSEINRKLLPNL